MVVDDAIAAAVVAATNNRKAAPPPIDTPKEDRAAESCQWWVPRESFEDFPRDRNAGSGDRRRCLRSTDCRCQSGVVAVAVVDAIDRRNIKSYRGDLDVRRMCRPK